jgi:hypothetical protein
LHPAAGRVERPAMEILHGCRAEYGPLDLRLQATAASNEFTVYVEDPRLQHPCVHEHEVQSSLESAKEYATLRADEYLGSREEAAPQKVKWRCS